MDFDFLDKLDKKLLLKINSTHTPFLDTFMFNVSEKLFWLPLYAFIVAFLIYKHRKNSWLVLLCIGLLITVSDQFSSGLMKPLFSRLRPCYDTSIKDLLHMVKGCGGQYGFISSHATNSFAICTFLSLLSKKFAIWFLAFIWAFFISYSRVYLAVHYPGDVIVGALAGILFGFIFYKIYNILYLKYCEEKLIKTNKD